MDYFPVQPINPKNLKTFYYPQICSLLSLLNILSWHIFERSLLGWEGQLLIKSGLWLSQNLLARNPNQVLNDNLFFHLKCAKAWLCYNLEPTLATTGPTKASQEMGLHSTYKITYCRRFQGLTLPQDISRRCNKNMQTMITSNDYYTGIYLNVGRAPLWGMNLLKMSQTRLSSLFFFS